MLDQDRPNDAHLYYLSEALSLNKVTLWSFLGDRPPPVFSANFISTCSARVLLNRVYLCMGNVEGRD